MFVQSQPKKTKFKSQFNRYKDLSWSDLWLSKYAPKPDDDENVSDENESSSPEETTPLPTPIIICGCRFHKPCSACDYVSSLAGLNCSKSSTAQIRFRPGDKVVKDFDTLSHARGSQHFEVVGVKICRTDEHVEPWGVVNVGAIDFVLVGVMPWKRDTNCPTEGLEPVEEWIQESLLQIVA